MKADVKERWITTLRSGEYPQTRKVLRDVHGYCCLGVLCDIIDPDGWDRPDDRPYGAKDQHLGSSNVPSPEILEAAGIGEDEIFQAADNEEDELYVLSELMNLNDRQRKNFNEIADWIEVNL